MDNNFKLYPYLHVSIEPQVGSLISPKTSHSSQSISRNTSAIVSLCAFSSGGRVGTVCLPLVYFAFIECIWFVSHCRISQSSELVSSPKCCSESCSFPISRENFACDSSFLVSRFKLQFSVDFSSSCATYWCKSWLLESSQVRMFQNKSHAVSTISFLSVLNNICSPLTSARGHVGNRQL